MVDLVALETASPHKNWYDEWEYKTFLLPAETIYVKNYGKQQRISLPAKSAGEWFFYHEDMLWIYAGRLITEYTQSVTPDWKSRLYDIVSMGDAISRIRAMVLLSGIDEESDHVYQIVELWANAQTWEDTMSVSNTVLYGSSFDAVKRASTQILRDFGEQVDISPDVLTKLGHRGRKPTKKNALPAVVIQNPTQRNMALQRWFDGNGDINSVPVGNFLIQENNATKTNTTNTKKPQIKQRRI